MAADTHNYGESRTFWERIAALAGRTAYREPMMGAGSAPQSLPADHELCIALGWARDRDNPNDIGPDMALDMVMRSPHYRERICRAVADELLAQKRSHACIRRNAQWLRRAAFFSYMRAVYDDPMRECCPEGVRPDDWLVLTEAAYRVMVGMAEEAVDRAAGYFYRAA